MAIKTRDVATRPVFSPPGCTLNRYSPDQDSGPRCRFTSIPSIRFDMFPNLVRWMFQSDIQCKFGEMVNFIFCECEVGGDEGMRMNLEDVFIKRRVLAIGKDSV